VKNTIILTLLAVCLAGALAQERNGESRDMLALGGGVMLRQEPYIGSEVETDPIPLINFVRGSFYVFGPSFGYRLYECPDWTFDAAGLFRFPVHNGSKDILLAGMQERHATVDLGAKLTRKLEWFDLKLGVLADVLNNHKGYEINLEASKRYDFEWLNLTPAVGALYHDDNFNEFYYGVRPSEARPTRSVYYSGDAVNWYAQLMANFMITENWTFTASVRYEWLPDEVTDSPIVGRDYTVSTIAGVYYKF
jgi:MipA family protein